MGYSDLDKLGDFLGDTLDTLSGKTSRDIAAQQKEANKQAQASDIISQREQTRQQVRQDRIRRAQLAQAAEASGSTGSSSVAGTAAALSTNLAVNQAFSSGQQNTQQNINAINQNIADLQLEQQLANQFVELAGTAAKAYAGGA